MAAARRPAKSSLPFALGVIALAAAPRAPAQEAAAGDATAAPVAAAGGTLSVHPASVTLAEPRRPQSLVVSLVQPDGGAADLTREATFTSDNEAVAAVSSHGWVEARAPGTAVVRVSVANQSAAVPVEVTATAVAPDGTAGQASSATQSFALEVMPVLSRMGCNSGACHGYSLGKNGFRMSLRGEDPSLDYYTLTEEYFGRRITREFPDRSLLLQKPLGELPHGGGVRFERDSEAHRILRSWIAEGAASDLATAPRIASVSVFPDYRVLGEPGMQQQLQVTATYSDGRSFDVTRWAVFESANQNVAEIDANGLVTTLARGESPIVVRYERLFAVSQIVVLDRYDAAGNPIEFTWSNPPANNYIDEHVFAKLRDMRISPSELSSDEEFLRRVYLDLIGVQPTPEEVRAFLADTSPDKRQRVVEELLARPEFIDHWSLKWGDLLQNSRDFMPEESVYAFREWLRSAIASNMPMDRFAREVLTGEGPVRESPTAAFYRVSTDPNESLERAVQVFVGVRMLCARCHSHPFENWTQGDYYGLASFFNQVGAKADPLNPADQAITLNLGASYATHPRTGLPQPPRFLGGEEPEVPASADRRVVFAEWLTRPDNPYFARAMVNRIWSYFFGRGIIEPVDDIRITNPPVNAALLEALERDFVASGFDARHLMRTMVGSRTYQLSSRTNATNAHDLTNFSHAVPRRLSAEQLMDSLGRATGVPEQFAGAPAGFTAAQLPDTNFESAFLDLFGRPARMEACECERTNETNMLQALHLINSETVFERVANPGGRVAQLVARQDLTDDQLIEELYLAALCRLPRREEMQVCLAHFAQYQNRAEAAQDLMWALLNSTDFLFIN